MLFKDLLVTPNDLVLAVASHLVEGDLVLALVFLDANHGSDDGHGLLVEAFHHLQFFQKHKVTIIAAVFLQLLVLEHAEQMQLHQAHGLLAVEIDGILAEEDVVFQKVFIISVFVAIFGKSFHLFDEQVVQCLGAERVDGDLRLRKRDDEQR